MTDLLSNVNFQILLKQHGGNIERAVKAWEQICSLGKFGTVPPTYEGGLDVQSLRTAVADTKAGQYMRQNPFAYQPGQPPFFTEAPITEDDIKRIEDIAAGDGLK